MSYKYPKSVKSRYVELHTSFNKQQPKDNNSFKLSFDVTNKTSFNYDQIRQEIRERYPESDSTIEKRRKL